MLFHDAFHKGRRMRQDTDNDLENVSRGIFECNIRHSIRNKKKIYIYIYMSDKRVTPIIKISNFILKT